MSEKNISGKIAIAAHQNIKERDYWTGTLSGIREKSIFPYDISAAPGDGKHGHGTEKGRVERPLPTPLVERLAKISGGSDHTIHMVLAAGLALLLDKYRFAKPGNKDDILLGTPIYKQETETDFINTILPLRCRLTEENSFKELLIHVRQQVIDAVAHQNYPVVMLPEMLELPDTGDGFPLFDVSLWLDAIHYESYLEGVDASISFGFLKEKKSTGMDLVITFDAGKYREDAITRLAGHFVTQMEGALSNLDAPVTDIPLMAEEERQTVLEAFNANASAGKYPLDRTIHRLFEAQAQCTPDAVAVIAEVDSCDGQTTPCGEPLPGVKNEVGETTLTYGQLNERANRLAHFLRKKGVGPDTIVGLMVNYSLDMIAGILGILKAGGAYLPINPETPVKRINSLLKDSGAGLLLTTGQVIREVAFLPLQGFESIDIRPFATAPRPQVEDLDTLQIPDRSLVDYEKFRPYIGQAMVKNSVTIHMSRGCVYNCAYCFKIWARKYILRSAENIFEEIKLYYDMGVRRFAFVDDLPNINVEVSSKVFQSIIDSGMKVHLHFPNGIRGDILTPDYIDLMVAAGAITMDLALETTSPRLQKLVRKNLNLERLAENIEYITTNHPHVILELQILHGIPSETEEEARHSLDFIKNVKWVHFPYIHILNIYPQSDMAEIAVRHGITREAILRSADLAYHELPETLPFPDAFTLQYQSEFLNQYFLSKERLLTVLPHQMRVLTEDELVQKYNSYLPVDIHSFSQLLAYAGIRRDQLDADFLPDDYGFVPGLNETLKAHFEPLREEPEPDAMRVLLLDLTQFFTHDTRIMYDVVEPPLGLMYLLSYANRKLGGRIHGRIAKSRIDFDSYESLRELVEAFKPDVIGIRSLNFYKDFFHQAVSRMRQWGVTVPIIAGGPYASSNFPMMLKDKNVDLAVIGEGEITFVEVLEAFLDNNKQLPDAATLREIPGLAFMEEEKKPVLERENREVVLMDAITDVLAGESAENPEPVNQAGDLAYIIYTSGSTGIPKGVLISHGNLVNQLSGLRQTFEFDASRKYLLLAAFTFDVSVMHIFSPLITGARLHLINEETRKDSARLWQFIGEKEIDVLNIVPTFMEALLESIENKSISFKYLFVGGDVFRPRLYEKLKATFDVEEIINIYGPTETTINALLYRCRDGVSTHSLPIGKPLINYGAYILDGQLNPVPIGVAGELCLFGSSVSRGYLNRPELTAESFIPIPPSLPTYNQPKSESSNLSDSPLHRTSPITVQSGVQGPATREGLKPPLAARRVGAPGGASEASLLYKTGDLARWLPGGNIEFVGRIDHQVKIRGFRIELGEIENRLLKNEHIKEAIVMAREDKSGSRKYLCAYVVPHKASETTEGTAAASVSSNISSSRLRDFLARELPDYMVPSYFVTLEKLPLKSSGKVDLRVLPEPGSIEEEGVYVAPANGLEEKLAEIWSAVLEMEQNKVSVNANFFHLGGHSLKATILLARIHKELKVKIPMVELFEQTTIRKLAGYIAKMEQEAFVSVEKVEDRSYYPLSSAQRRLYFIQQLERDTIAYNMPRMVNLGMDMDTGRLEGVFQELIDRHESLRTAFILVNGQPVQRVLEAEETPFKMEVFEPDMTDTTALDGDQLRAQFMRPFDLAQAPLLRVGLVKIPGSNPLLMVDMHHIITDGVSQDVLTKEFFALYSGERLPHLNLQYRDYAVWLNGPLQQQALSRQSDFWLQQFADEVPVLELPTDFPRPMVQRFEGNAVFFTFSPEESRGIEALARMTDSTLFMSMLAVFTLLLSKLSGQEDIVIGTPIAARRHADLEHIIGMFVNTLAMRNRPSGDKSFYDFLKEVKERTLKAFDNQEYQFEDLVDNVAVRRDTARNPVFDVLFNLANEADYSGELPQPQEGENGEPVGGYFHKEGISKFDLSLMVLPQGDGLGCSLEYASALFKPATIDGYIRYFKRLVSVLAADPGIPLAEVQLIKKEERERLVFGLNETKTEYPRDATIQELFAQQAAQTGDAAALVYENEVVSYGELLRRARCLAALLKSRGVQPEESVAIMMPSSIEMIVGVLGILEAGAAYLPLNVLYPDERKAFMIKESGANVMLAMEAEDIPGLDVIALSDSSIYNGTPSETPVSSETGGDSPANNLAYIIYTSGSTGKPKGVMVEHRNVVRLVKNTNFVELKRGQHLLQTGALEFDASTFELWGALLNGLTLCLVHRDNLIDAGAIKTTIGKHDISTMWLTSPLFTQVAARDVTVFQDLENLLVGGDVLSPPHIEKVREACQDLNIINGYGPTENTTFSTTFPIRQAYDFNIPIGSPIANSTAYIVDPLGNPAPVNVPGELWVGGDGVARGYLNDDELTKEKFLPDPFRKDGRIYRTGDRARWLADGSIEFLGRIDQQVKIRGFRVEPGEIENRLRLLEEVKAAVVVTGQKRSGEKYLCAYIVPEGGVETKTVRQRLALQVPDYMLPAYFVSVEKIPLTPHGKIDRRKLPAPETAVTGGAFVAPGSSHEKQIAAIWKEVLEVPEVGVETNFFELGGNSINFITINARLKEELNVEIPIAVMFRFPTVRGLANYLTGADKEEIADRKVEKQEGKDRLAKMRNRRRR